MSSLQLPSECMRDIFISQDIHSLFRHIQVNKYWCSNAIQVLWQQPFNNPEYEMMEYIYEISRPLENLIVRTLIACMNDESKKTLREARINLSNDPATNIKPFFNYPSFIQNFDYHGVFKSVYVCIKENEDEAEECKFQRFLLYRELCRLIFTHGSAVKYSLGAELHHSIHNENISQPLFPEQLQLSNIDGSYSKFDLLKITSCLSSDHLSQIARNCKEIKKLELLFCSCEDNSGIIALINNANYIYSLKLDIHFTFNLTTIPTNIFNAIRNKLHLIREVELELFNNFPIEIFSECKILRKLKIFCRNTSGLNEKLKILKLFVNFDIFENLEAFHVSMEIANIFNIIEIIRKSNGNLKNINLSLRRFQDPENYTTLFKIIALNCKNLKFLTIIVTEDTIRLIPLLFSSCNNLIQIIFSVKNYFDISNYMVEIGRSIVYQPYLQDILFQKGLFISQEVTIEFLNIINENVRNNHQRMFQHSNSRDYNMFYNSRSCIVFS